MLEEHDTKKELPFQSNTYFKRTCKRMYSPACCWRALKSESGREGTKGAHTVWQRCCFVGRWRFLSQQAADLPHLSLPFCSVTNDARPLLATLFCLFGNGLTNSTYFYFILFWCLDIDEYKQHLNLMMHLHLLLLFWFLIAEAWSLATRPSISGTFSVEPIIVPIDRQEGVVNKKAMQKNMIIVPILCTIVMYMI